MNLSIPTNQDAHLSTRPVGNPMRTLRARRQAQWALNRARSQISLAPREAASATICAPATATPVLPAPAEVPRPTRIPAEEADCTGRMHHLAGLYARIQGNPYIRTALLGASIGLSVSLCLPAGVMLESLVLRHLACKALGAIGFVAARYFARSPAAAWGAALGALAAAALVSVLAPGLSPLLQLGIAGAGAALGSAAGEYAAAHQRVLLLALVLLIAFTLLK